MDNELASIPTPMNGLNIIKNELFFKLDDLKFCEP